MKSFSECFAEYQAKLANPQWAVSALAEDGAVVISCWSVYFSKPAKDVLRYEDTLSRWEGNAPGNNLLRSHVQSALDGQCAVRLIVATPVDRVVVDQGSDASEASKKFHTRPDLVGRVTDFDGDRFVIDFRLAIKNV